jgi:hypothetical protein
MRDCCRFICSISMHFLLQSYSSPLSFALQFSLSKILSLCSFGRGELLGRRRACGDRHGGRLMGMGTLCWWVRCGGGSGSWVNFVGVENLSDISTPLDSFWVSMRNIVAYHEHYPESFVFSTSIFNNVFVGPCPFA